MDRPDAVGHCRRQCGVSSPAQGRLAGAPGRGAPWSARAGQPVDQSEDIVQDILLAVHLKRHTWDVTAPFAPWLFAIARNKLIDALRRRGRRIFVNIDDFAETLPGETPSETASASEVAAQLQSLPSRQRDVLQSIAVDSASIKDTAAKFSMSEGAVRVALHRGLASLTAKLREN